jgi:hypothetical protein
MSRADVTYLIACLAGAVVIVAWATLILVPAWSSYTRVWERVAAAVLSLYVLAAFVLIGGGVAAAFLWYFDRL